MSWSYLACCPLLGRLVETRRCPLCLVAMPLGPANDDSDAVRVEMRALDIADGWSFTAEESEGNVGYLARCIVEHDKEQG
jgi:hypothetical protein